MNAIEREALKQKFIREYTQKYIHLIPEYLRDNDSFLVFFALLCREFNITLDNVRSFNDIINPDKAPKQFLEMLGMYFNNHYQDRAPESFNRELITRSRKLFEDRGNEHSIIMAATHGNNEGYLGGDIFIPGYELNPDIAELVVARERMFYHSKKSKFSSFHVYSDGDTYRPGVLIIILSYLDSDIRNKLWEVIPAGIRLRYNILIDFRPNKQDPIDLYDFNPPIGVPKSNERTLTWYPYFRVVPILEHGDLKTSVNNPLGFEYNIDMGIYGGYINDILIHSDGTVNKWLFDEDGILQGGLNNIKLLHGRKIHSGMQMVSVHYTNEHSIGVSALPLSKVRRPFNLSSIPENAEIIETNEEVIIRPGYYNEIIHTIPEKESFKHDKETSKHSGEDVFGGIAEEITETEQEYVEPEKIIIKKKDYNFYRITPTGEYEDRIDKLTTDSVMRGFDTTLDLETKVQKFHNPRRFSHNSGRHSGTYYNEKLNSIIRSIFLDGVLDRVPYKDVMDIEYYAKNKIVDDLTQTLDLIEEHITLYGEVQELTSEIKSLETQLYKLNPAAYNYTELQEEINSKNTVLYSKTKRISQIIDTVNGIRLEILQIFDEGELEHPINKELKKLFEELYKWYPAQNAIMSGIFIPGDVNEYVPIMTIQPFDTLYPISEILDEKADFNRPWDRHWWDGSEDTKDTYGLNQYGENRNPFYTPEIKYQTLYEPTTDGENVNMSYNAVHGLDIHHIEDTNIVKDATKTLIHSASGDILSGRFLLEVIHDREDGYGVVTETKPVMIHNEFKFSGSNVFCGTSKEVLDRMYYTDMDSHIDPQMFVEILNDYELDNNAKVYDIEIEVEEYTGPGSIYSMVHSAKRGLFSWKALYDGRPGYTRRTSPEGSFTHSARADGKHSTKSTFSGSSSWMIEPIIDATDFDGKMFTELEVLDVMFYDFDVSVETETTRISPTALIFSSPNNYIGKWKSSYHSGKLLDPYAYKEPTKDSIIHSKFSTHSGHYTFGGSELYPGEPYVYASRLEASSDIEIELYGDYEYQFGNIELEVESYIVPYNSLIISSPKHKHSSYRMLSGEWVFKKEPLVDMRSSVEPKVINDVAIGIEVSSYDVNVSVDIPESDYIENAINFSYSDAKFSTLKAKHSGDIERPTSNSIVYSGVEVMSTKQLHDGKLLTT